MIRRELESDALAESAARYRREIAELDRWDRNLNIARIVLFVAAIGVRIWVDRRAAKGRPGLIHL
jgi:hypothetical protein